MNPITFSGYVYQFTHGPFVGISSLMVTTVTRSTVASSVIPGNLPNTIATVCSDISNLSIFTNVINVNEENTEVTAYIASLVHKALTVTLNENNKLVLKYGTEILKTSV